MKIVGKVFAVIYSIIFTIFLTAFVFCFSISTIFTKNFVNNVLNDIDLKQITVSDLDLGTDITDKYGSDATIEDVVVGELVNAGLEKEQAEKIVNDENIKSFISDKAITVIDAVVNEKEIEEVKLSEIEKSFSSLELSQSEYEDMTNAINEIIREFNNGGLEW